MENLSYCYVLITVLDAKRNLASVAFVLANLATNDVHIRSGFSIPFILLAGRAA